MIAPTRVIDVAIVEDAIGVKVDKWRGHCHEVASMILGAKLVAGKLRYGHWIGPVHPKSMFAKYPHGIVRHGWIERADGTIVDATRFEFENAEPYIYVGKNDYYDAGGNRFRMDNLKPAPDFDDRERQFILKSVRAYNGFVKKRIDYRIIGCDVIITLKQAFWMANAPLSVLGKSAKDVFEALIEMGLGAFIPIDNRHIVLGGE